MLMEGRYVDMAEDTADRPEPDRQVSVEEAHLLHDQIEFSEEEYENSNNEIEQAYHQDRVKHSQELASGIEESGLSESDLKERKSELEAESKKFDEENVEFARVMAKLDSVKMVLEEYFGAGTDKVEVEVMQTTGFDDGSVAVKGAGGIARISFTDEMQARAFADCVLDVNGLEEEAAQVGRR